MYYITLFQIFHREIKCSKIKFEILILKISLNVYINFIFLLVSKIILSIVLNASFLIPYMQSEVYYVC